MAAHSSKEINMKYNVGDLLINKNKVVFVYDKYNNEGDVWYKLFTVSGETTYVNECSSQTMYIFITANSLWKHIPVKT
jgi:hypothetical protein